MNYSDVIPGLIGLIPRISINNVQLADTVMFTIGKKKPAMYLSNVVQNRNTRDQQRWQFWEPLPRCINYLGFKMNDPSCCHFISERTAR